MNVNMKHSQITRKGKIARLPYELREQVNHHIRDGAPAARLNAILVHNGHDAVSDQNWTNWRQGGYQDWLREQAYLDEIREEYEAVRRQLEAGGFSVLDKAILDVVLDFKSSGLTPDKIASAIAALKTAVNGSERVKIADQRTKLAEQALAFERDKFRFKLAENILRFAKDAKVQEIVARSGSSQEDNIKAILAYMDQVEAAAIKP